MKEEMMNDSIDEAMEADDDESERYGVGNLSHALNYTINSIIFYFFLPSISNMCSNPKIQFRIFCDTHFIMWSRCVK